MCVCVYKIVRSRGVCIDHVRCGTGPEKSGEYCHPRTPGKDAGLYHRVSEEPRKGAKRNSRAV